MSPASRYYFDDIVAKTAKRYGLDPVLVKALTLVESSGMTHAYRYEPAFWRRYLETNPKWKDSNPYRVSASYGLMQVMYPVAVEDGWTIEPEDMFKPAVGLEVGCRHFRKLLTKAGGDIEMALAQYNGGRGGNTARPLRNQSYATKVLTLKRKLEVKAAPHAAN